MGVVRMPTFSWRELLTQWSKEIIESGEYEGELPPEVVASGWLGYPGATDDEIAAAEARLGTTFPPSYREFLKVTNGWRMTTTFIRKIRSTEEVEWLATQDQEMIDIWMEGEQEVVSDEEYLVYGRKAVQPLRAEYLQTALAVSDYGDGIYLLNPQIVTPEGEWEAWFFAHWVPGADRYRSFWELMQTEHEHFLYVLKSERGEPTPYADPSLGVDAEDLDGIVAALKTPQHRLAALEALGNLRDTRAFEPVLEIFQDPDEDLFTRECAARTLGELRDPRAVKPLIDTFRITPEQMSRMKLTSLPGIDHIPGGASMLDDVFINDMISYLESLFGTAMADHLRATLTPEAIGKGLADHLKHAVRQGLLTLGDVALPGLLDALQDADPNVRREVASILCYVQSRENDERIIRALTAVQQHDPDPHVRNTAAQALRNLKGRQSDTMIS